MLSCEAILSACSRLSVVKSGSSRRDRDSLSALFSTCGKCSDFKVLITRGHQINKTNTNAIHHLPSPSCDENINLFPCASACSFPPN